MAGTTAASWCSSRPWPGPQRTALSSGRNGRKCRSLVEGPLPLYPRLHMAPDQRVHMSGCNAMTHLLDTSPRDGATVQVTGPLALTSRGFTPSVRVVQP